jgi:hypothetical protein
MSHGGFGADATAWRAARGLTPFLIAEKPCVVWYFDPVLMTTGMPRNSLTGAARIVLLMSQEYRTV